MAKEGKQEGGQISAKVKEMICKWLRLKIDLEMP